MAGSWDGETLESKVGALVDFSVKDDVLHLSRAIFTALALGELDVPAFDKAAALDADLKLTEADVLIV